MKALLLALLLPLPAAAGPLTDALMAPGLFAGAPDGPLLAYAEQRTVPDGAARADVDGRLLVAAEPGPRGRQLAVTRAAGGKVEPIAAFPASGPNPVLLYFLETTARDMAAATGGSPFYIRNRIREALAAAPLGPADAPGAVVLRPFAADPNRARMGAFADLALRLRFDPERPDRILELSADTTDAAGGYHQTLRLVTED
jgi:hypothetical protein